ncbi:hypothetical protein KC902_00470 [Candidatus Kaiserbacteria bacterium]|nr:hypothetical protein [Candidatus Kaiserbacteria bacterium]USN88904.1 MAG: hypothetical protein H6780_00565 [Candidatus Nomurabacteria bacterium]
MSTIFFRALIALCTILLQSQTPAAADESRAYVYGQANQHEGSPLTVLIESTEYVVLSPSCKEPNNLCQKVITLTVTSVFIDEHNQTRIESLQLTDELQDGSVDEVRYNGRLTHSDKANEIYRKALIVIARKLQEQAVARLIPR